MEDPEVEWDWMNGRFSNIFSHSSKKFGDVRRRRTICGIKFLISDVSDLLQIDSQSSEQADRARAAQAYEVAEQSCVPLIRAAAKPFNLVPIIEKYTAEAESGALEKRVGQMDTTGVKAWVKREILDKISQEISPDQELPSEATVRRRVSRIADRARQARKKI